MKWYSRSQFSLFRAFFGAYLALHFAQLIPYAPELFSNKGMLPEASELPTYGVFPNILFALDEPWEVQLFLGVLSYAAASFSVGVYRRRFALLLWYGWACLLNRNPFISNPGLAYVGWLLLMCTLVPKGEEEAPLWVNWRYWTGVKGSGKSSSSYRLSAATVSPGVPPRRWEVPDSLYYGSWVVLSLSYTVSGIHKLGCPSWVDGTALKHVLTSPLVRPWVLPWMASSEGYILPPEWLDLGIAGLTWTSLAAEIGFVFFGTPFRLRKWYWMFFISFHLGILATINFTDLTLGVLSLHLFTFDASWFSWSRNWVTQQDFNGIPPIDPHEPKPVHVELQEMRKVFQEGIQQASVLPGKLAKKVVRFEEHSSASPTKEPDESWGGFTIWAFWAVVVTMGGMWTAAHIRGDSGVVQLISDFFALGVEMSWIFGFLVAAFGGLMLLEFLFPDQPLAPVPGWWRWNLGINAFQLFAVILATFTWERWMQESDYFTSSTGWHLRDHVSPLVGGFLAYLINQHVFFWWHRSRHDVYVLWLLFHQFHHSPSRLQTPTAFYKHPLEILADSFIMAFLVYSVLGLTKDSSLWLSFFSALGEYFYHMNLRTPQWIGYFFQRPESHRLHHGRNKREHCPNYSDFPLWDWLGGTFENPKEMNEPTGFGPVDRECRRWDMLCFKDVVGISRTNLSWEVPGWDIKRVKKTARKTGIYALVLWGAASSLGFLGHSDVLDGIAWASVASPKPLVFSQFRGIETFSLEYTAIVSVLGASEVDPTTGRLTTTTHHWSFPLDALEYSKLHGPYPRRNVYGAMFSHGILFDFQPPVNSSLLTPVAPPNPKMLHLRQRIVQYGFCQPGPLAREWGIVGGDDRDGGDSGQQLGGSPKLQSVQISARSKSQGAFMGTRVLSVWC